MRHDLSPLHVSEGELRIRNVLLAEHDQRQQTRVGQFLAGDGGGRAGDAIAVLGGQQTAVRAVRGTPSWVLQIVTRAVQRTVASLGAHRRGRTLGGGVVGAQEGDGVLGLGLDEWSEGGKNRWNWVLRNFFGYTHAKCGALEWTMCEDGW